MVNIAATSAGSDLRALVRHLRETGQLTAGLILRALLSGNTDMFEFALAELTGMSEARVGAILHERGGSGLTALLTRAGFPESTFAAFRAALSATEEIGFIGTVDGAARLRRRMVERVLTSCAQDASDHRGAADAAAALRDGIGARGSARVLRRTGRRTSDRPLDDDDHLIAA